MSKGMDRRRTAITVCDTLSHFATIGIPALLRAMVPERVLWIGT